MASRAPRTTRAHRARTSGWSWRGTHATTRVAFVLLALAAARAAAAAPDDAGPFAGAAAGSAGTRPAGGGAWLSLGLLTGSTRSDPRLADYQWDVSLRPAWGAQALVGRGRLAAGVRLWRLQTTQRIDLPGATVSPQVGLTSVELVGLGRLGAIGGTELLLTAGVGRRHLGYDPDQITIPVSRPGIPIVVPLSAVDEWTGGGGLAVRRGLGPRWSLGLGVDLEFFGLDTAHRSGAAVVYGRESLGEWSARLEIARRFHRH